MGQDYLSLIDAVFDQFFKFMVQYVTRKCSGSTPEWTHIPQAVLTAITDMYADWYTAYSKMSGPYTRVDREAKNDAKRASKKAIRAFVNQYLRFPPVTDEDRTAMHIPNHDTHPSPIPIPGDIPEVEAQTPLPRVLRFRFRRANMKRWGAQNARHFELGVCFANSTISVWSFAEQNSKTKALRLSSHGMELVWVLADTPLGRWPHYSGSVAAPITGGQNTEYHKSGGKPMLSWYALFARYKSGTTIGTVVRG